MSLTMLAKRGMVGLALSLASAGWAQQAGAIRVVECDSPVQSRKRGICANQMSEEDFRAIAPGVSWFYNWHYQSNDMPPAGVNVEFVPMVWGSDAKRLEGFAKYMEAGHKARAVLAINEPNLKGQAFITPEETARGYLAIKAVADKYKIPVIGPHMALGSAKDASITAMDPLEKKSVTYTFMVPFLKAFLFHMGNAEVPATAYHTYGDINEMRWAVDMMYKEFKRPMWVTEYAQWKAGGAAGSRKFLILATDMLERSPNVQGYAWFKERVRDNKDISLFEVKSGKLTELGETYVKMPVHDADLYYRLPGNLEAERYVSMEKMEIAPAADGEGFLQMGATAGGGWAEYNVQVDKAGAYEVEIRVGGATGSVDLAGREKTLATVAGTKDWQTLKATVQLGAGPQKVRVKLGSAGQAINWMKFTRR